MEKLKEILRKVQKPGRYIGGEVNSVCKEHSKDKTSIVLAYPDIYEIGMSYLGLKILYHLLNEKKDVFCERAFMPWGDMEEELVKNDMKLYSLESKTSLNKFDIIGFSLSYELTYTNVLSILNLSGVSVCSEDRKEDEPLVIAGGACVFNPEPMSKFIDIFLIGDGEDVLPDFVSCYGGLKKQGKTKKEIFMELSKIPGVYVPSLYNPEYSGKKFLGLKPVNEDVPSFVKKTVVKDFENTYYPEKQIVPLIKIIHDRISVEIMRGCPNNCRFCQASSINRPVRIRSVDKISDICEKTYKQTGYENISLLSLSSVNYPHIIKLIKELNDKFKSKGVGLSMPSLRVDEAFYKLPEVISIIRKAGLTFAPESASSETRKSLGKEIDIDVLCKSVLCAFAKGWNKVKLYFMVGFPVDETDEAKEIMKLAIRLSQSRKNVSKRPAEVRISINPFVPKSHTPLQWLGMKKEKDLLVIKDILRKESTKKIHAEFHQIRQSVLEACLARGDRKTGNVVITPGKKVQKWIAGESVLILIPGRNLLPRKILI
jgi:radical SAM family uncharacterized protein